MEEKTTEDFQKEKYQLEIEKSNQPWLRALNFGKYKFQLSLCPFHFNSLLVKE